MSDSKRLGRYRAYDTFSTHDQTVGRHERHANKVSHSSATEIVERCVAECANVADSRSNSDAPCCRGGLTSLKMNYQGFEAVTFFLPEDPVLINMEVSNSCPPHGSPGGGTKSGKGGKGSHGIRRSSGVARFVRCNGCFPDALPSLCDLESESTLQVQASPGDDICILSVDVQANISMSDDKLPTDLTLLFQDASSYGQVLATTIHTSCSKPIAPPYGVEIGTCHRDNAVRVDDFALFGTAHGILEFVDGKSVADPSSSLSSCQTPEANSCCKGGASFLRARLGGLGDRSGLLTLSAIEANCTSVAKGKGGGKGGKGGKGINHGKKTSAVKAGKGGKGGKGSTPAKVTKTASNGISSRAQPEVRFVPCHSPCLNPFASIACDIHSDHVLVQDGRDVCFGSWDPQSQTVTLERKLPTNLKLFLIPDDGSAVLSISLHTSCSTQLTPPYAQTFTAGCNVSPRSQVFSIDQATHQADGPRLEFVDGISRDLYLAASVRPTTSVDITFAGCGCRCNSTSAQPTSLSSPAAPALSPSLVPSTMPSGPLVRSHFPSATPTATDHDTPSIALPSSRPQDGTKQVATLEPTSEPRFSPSEQPTNFPSSSSCEQRCADWVQDNCVVAGDDGTLLDQPCDLTMFDDHGGRRALEVSSVALDNAIKYHDQMVDVYEELMKYI